MNSSTTVKISETIAALRKEAGETQKELADALGVSNKVISKWEKSESEPALANIVALAKHFGVSTDSLIRGAEFEVEVNQRKDFREAALDAFQEGINHVFRFVRREYIYNNSLKSIPLIPPTGVRFGENEGDYTGISSNEIFMQARSSKGNNMILTLLQNEANYAWMTENESELRSFFGLLAEPGIIQLVRLIHTNGASEYLSSRYAAEQTGCSEENARRLFETLRFRKQIIEMPGGTTDVWSISEASFLLGIFACAFETILNTAQDGTNVIKNGFRPILPTDETEGE